MNVLLHRIVYFTLVAGFVAACAKLPPPIPQPSELQRSQFGRVGVVSVNSPPEAQFVAPNIGRGRGAARGAGGGALHGAAAAVDSMGGCSGSICGLQILLIPAFALVGAIVGGVAGATDAIPTDTAERIERQIRRALMDSNAQTVLRRNVILAARHEGVLAVEEFSEAGRETLSQEADYRALRSKGFDTVLEVGVTKLGLVGRAGQGGTDPRLSLVMQAGVRLVNTKTNDDIYSRKTIIVSRPSRKFSEWGAENAALLRKELNNIFSDAAEKVVVEVFLVIR